MTVPTPISAFTKAEKVSSVAASLGTLSRFIRSVKHLKLLFLPTLVLSCIAVSLPQAFLWLSGIYVQCDNRSSCSSVIPLFNTELSVGIGLLSSLVVTSFIMRLLSWSIFEVGGEWLMQDFHAKMVSGLRGVRTTYFDENPSGRLVNRMVNDYEHLRTSCIVRMGDTMQAFLEVLSVAGMVVIAQPVVGLLILPTVFMFLYIQWGIAPMLQRLTAIRSIRMGEVLHRETDLVEGAKTFVLYNAERALLHRLRVAVTRYVQIHLLRVKIEAWGRILSNSVTSVYSFLSVLCVALAIHSGSISLVIGSAIITVLLRLTPTCSWLSWSMSMVIESVGVTKRVFEVIDLPKQEIEEFSPAYVSKEGSSSRLFSQSSPSVFFPKAGDIEFLNYSMSYRADTPIIIRDLSLTLPAGKKIGIIGRTGVGKTSLFQSLFRFVHVHSGDIRWAGISLLSAPVDQVRELFGVVPQEPYLFSGTIRSNLDPDSVLTDEVLHEALRKVGMPLSLTTPIEEGGRNLSVGERQLVCLARVIVIDRPVILLDEPTSAVDNATDLKVQTALNTVMKDKTVIAIAHRLETLSDYDMIIEVSAEEGFRVVRGEGSCRYQ